MNFTEQSGEKRDIRLILMLPWCGMVLVEQHDGIHRLPRINILRGTRTAEQICGWLRAKWGIRSAMIDLLQGSSEMSPCAVVEIRTLEWNFMSNGFVSLSADDIDEQELTGAERLVVRDVIAGEARDRGPFSRLGWIEEAQEWIRENVNDHKVNFNEDVHQFSATGFCALVRFGTTHGPAYWLKATSGPNAHEFTVTQAVGRYCSEFVPPLIAARTDWNAWVTEEVGQSLCNGFCLHALEESTRCLAKMQIQSAAHIEPLLSCGCCDQRMHILRAQLPKLIQYLEDAMARQTSTKSMPLNSERLCELGSLLEKAAAKLEASAIPETLIHNDMNPGNVLFDGVRAVFTDWSEACVGNPFLTFQHLRVQASEADETRTWATRLKETYKACWSSVLNESQMETAFALSPPLAIASQLCGRDPSFICSYRDNESVRSYTRSLARHMDRFAHLPQFLEALCN